MDRAIHPLRAYRLRQEPRLRLKDLAVRIGTSKGNLSRIENGKQLVSEDLLPKVAAETGIPASKLRPDLAALMRSR